MPCSVSPLQRTLPQKASWFTIPIPCVFSIGKTLFLPGFPFAMAEDRVLPDQLVLLVQPELPVLMVLPVLPDQLAFIAGI